MYILQKPHLVDLKQINKTFSLIEKQKILGIFN